MDVYDDFQRYLRAKVTIDDRALNKDVWKALVREVTREHHRPLRVLEVGAGIGTMAQRLWRWRLHPSMLYTGVDSNSANIAYARQWLRAWTHEMQIATLTTAQGLMLQDGKRQLAISLVDKDALALAQHGDQSGAWDVLIAHAFLDLVDLSSALPLLLTLLRRGGWAYFTLNFDGVTVFEPVLDTSYEEELMNAYHASMDQRLVAGKPSGDSRSGRHLYGHLRAAGAEILAVGASDWVVIPQPRRGYLADEAYFLHFIIQTVHRELQAHPEVGGARLDAWAAKRHRQVESGELFYLAHQLDYLAVVERKVST